MIQAGPSESDTCRAYVLPKLRAAGWSPDQIIEQYPITDGRIVPHGRKLRRERPLRARAKPGAGRVRWMRGAAADLPPLQVDLATMTGNVAQVFLTDGEWKSALRSVLAALRPGGRLVFETRDPAAKAWLEWNRAGSLSRTDIPGAGAVETWVEVSTIRGDLVCFHSTFVFEADGATLTSESTLRFRRPEEVTESLMSAGFVVEDLRGAPDRPGRELVFVARRHG